MEFITVYILAFSSFLMVFGVGAYKLNKLHKKHSKPEKPAFN